MDRKRVGAVVALAGAVLLVLSLFADVFGYGEGGFGWKQTVGSIVGAAAVLVGLGALWWKRGGEVTSAATGR